MPFHDARKFTDAGRRDGTDAKTDAYTVPVTDRRRSSSIAKGSTRSQCTLLVLYACDQHMVVTRTSPLSKFWKCSFSDLRVFYDKCRHLSTI